jgi:Fic family protein
MKVKETYNKYADWSKNKPINFELFNQHAIINHSDTIEGSTLTLDETRLLLDKGLTPKNKPIEHSLMAIDHLNALQFILSIAKDKTPLNKEIIQKLGGLIKKSTGSIINSLGGTHDETKGEFRKNSVYAGSRMFVDFQKIPSLIEQLILDVNSQINQSSDFILSEPISF